MCLIMYVKSKCEMINPNQRNNEILKFSKTKVKFEISTFEIGYMQNFVKIRKLICPKVNMPKMPKCRSLGYNFTKTNDKFDFSTFKIEYIQNLVKI